ncbi:MAG: 2-amino-4-hydroxy-6-hydroxymethyldihydropteridine diphosphokinase [Vicinamibacterales bacterium]
MPGRVVAVAFGSNIGDRRGQILTAAREVAAVLDGFVLSPIIETAPVGAGLDNDPPYLNAAGIGTSSRPGSDVFAALRAIEFAAGRTRPYPGAPRTLDLDLILAGEDVVEEPDLQIPHPRFRERLFVLEPLAAIAPDLIDPVSGRTVAELLASVREKGPER